ncbi:hypothetical protein M422DRAFT_58899 [Sphaerobolus stellatus SS14]|nr:hypothetical protein M422DRAFT_58899 [Sphaerobolus stellatus SS14]
MDPFEVRMQFLNHLKRLTAAQHSIHKIVTFALKYYSRCGEDLWECILEECEKGNTNTRINILYFLDSLCEKCLSSRPPTSSTSKPVKTYVDYVTRDLKQVVDLVVPDVRSGLLNLMSTRQVLESWRAKRVIDPTVVDQILEDLDKRKERIHDLPTVNEDLSAHEVQKRIEEDRERHKRLRERRWVQPTTRSTAQPRLASFYPLPSSASKSSSSQHLAPPTTSAESTAEALPIDVEFENAWETTSDWNEDDDEAALEENVLCFGDDEPPLPSREKDPDIEMAG